MASAGFQTSIYFYFLRLGHSHNIPITASLPENNFHVFFKIIKKVFISGKFTENKKVVSSSHDISPRFLLTFLFSFYFETGFVTLY